MFKLLFLIPFLMFPIELTASQDGTFKPGTEPKSFRKIPWGAEFSELKKFQFVETGSPGSPNWLPRDYKHHKRYVRQKEKLDLGGIKLERIEYLFWRNELLCVGVDFKGCRSKKNKHSNIHFLAMKKYIFDKYGKGSYDKEKSFYRLKGNSTLILLGEHDLSTYCYGCLFFGSTKLLKEHLDTEGLGKFKNNLLRLFGFHSK